VFVYFAGLFRTNLEDVLKVKQFEQF